MGSNPFIRSAQLDNLFQKHAEPAVIELGGHKGFVVLKGVDPHQSASHAEISDAAIGFVFADPLDDLLFIQTVQPGTGPLFSRTT